MLRALYDNLLSHSPPSLVLAIVCTKQNHGFVSRTSARGSSWRCSAPWMMICSRFFTSAFHLDHEYAMLDAVSAICWYRRSSVTGL